MIKPLIINNKYTNYIISDNGEIINSKTNKTLSGSIKNGYKTVKLTIDGKKKDYLIHRLVALSFLKNNDINAIQVNHINGDKLNNSVSNLEWITPSKNISHSYSLGRNSRQKIKSLDRDIINDPNWKQYLNTNYYFSKDGQGVNLKTKKYLNTSKTNNGYLKFSLYINGKSQNVLAHKIIYQVFYPEDKILSNEQINHIDGNKENNSILNLEKITNKENMMHSYYTLQQNIVGVKQYDLSYNLIKIYNSMSEAAKENNFNVSGISQAVNKKIKTYKGFIWEKV